MNAFVIRRGETNSSFCKSWVKVAACAGSIEQRVLPESVLSDAAFKAALTISNSTPTVPRSAHHVRRSTA
jgi:hypothetical protein